MSLAEQLPELHRIHRQISDLRERLARGPRQIKAGQANVAKSETELAAAKEVQKKARMKADERELQLEEREAHILKLRGQLNTCSTNIEFQGLKEQIDADLQANSVLSDEILETLEKIDELAAASTGVEEQLGQANAELNKSKERVAAEQTKLESELSRVLDELEKAEVGISGDFKRDYDRIITAKGEDGLAQVEGEICGGCYQMLTSQTMNELYMGRPIFCKSCGRLIYLPEGQGPSS